MVRRIFSCRKIDSVITDPSMFCRYGTDSKSTVRDLVYDLNNYVLEGECGWVAYVKKTNAIWEIHIIFDPTKERNIYKFLRMARDSIEYMKNNTPCKIIEANTPVDEKPALWMREKCNFITTHFHNGLSCGVLSL